jgi:hypothetical protein
MKCDRAYDKQARRVDEKTPAVVATEMHCRSIDTHRKKTYFRDLKHIGTHRKKTYFRDLKHIGTHRKKTYFRDLKYIQY